MAGEIMIPATMVERAKARSIESVITEFGVKLRGRKVERVGACPLCGGTDRFSINTKKQVFNCRRCQAGGDVIALVRFLTGNEFREACERLAGNIPAERLPEPAVRSDDALKEVADYQTRQLDKALWLWRNARPIPGTVGERYLRERRGYSGRIPYTVRFLGGDDKHLPTMVAAFGLASEPRPGIIVIDESKITGVHLTRLTPEGDKAKFEKPKTFLGASSGSPIVIAPPNDLLGLAITEGIEDALTAHQATRLGAWAAGAADRLPMLADVIPEYIEAVTVAAHTDEAGQRGASRLADLLDHRGIEVRIESLVS